jgi:hypothetical protein
VSGRNLWNSAKRLTLEASPPVTPPVRLWYFNLNDAFAFNGREMRDLCLVLDPPALDFVEASERQGLPFKEKGGFKGPRPRVRARFPRLHPGSGATLGVPLLNDPASRYFSLEPDPKGPFLQRVRGLPPGQVSLYERPQVPCLQNGALKTPL